jgi:uncharacterized small protein (DUF1192 family)
LVILHETNRAALRPLVVEEIENFRQILKAELEHALAENNQKPERRA